MPTFAVSLTDEGYLHLPAETRDRAGKGASRALRNEGRVPAVIYGDKKDPVGISLNERELVKALIEAGCEVRGCAETRAVSLPASRSCAERPNTS